MAAVDRWLVVIQFLILFAEFAAVFIVGVIIGHLLSRFRNNKEIDVVPPSSLDMSVIEVSLTERELEDMLQDAGSWGLERYNKFLSNFLLPREIAVLHALSNAFRKSKQSLTLAIDDTEEGWLNKHQVHLSSKVSRKVIYSRYGVLERLVDLTLATKKKSGPWSREKFKYRINSKNQFALGYCKAVLSSSVTDQ